MVLVTPSRTRFLSPALSPEKTTEKPSKTRKGRKPAETWKQALETSEY